MLDTVKINHVQHISFTQSRLTDAVSVILSELLSYEHPAKAAGYQVCQLFSWKLAPQERQVTVMVPLPRGTRSCWPQLGHLK